MLVLKQFAVHGWEILKNALYQSEDTNLYNKLRKNRYKSEYKKRKSGLWQQETSALLLKPASRTLSSTRPSTSFHTERGTKVMGY